VERVPVHSQVLKPEEIRGRSRMRVTKPEPVRPIRSLLRGLDALGALSAADGLTVTETARKAKLPRTTAYRVLETLRLGGYVERDEDDRYRATAKAAQLAALGEALSNGHAAPVKNGNHTAADAA
jgi:DNA-binding transcriptional ArsR family regulator